MRGSSSRGGRPRFPNDGVCGHLLARRRPGAALTERSPSQSFEWQVLHAIHPFVRLRCFGDEFQVGHELPYRRGKLASERKACKLKAFPLPLLRERLEPDVLGEDQSPNLPCVLK